MTRKLMMMTAVFVVLGVPIMTLAQTDSVQAQAVETVRGEVVKIDTETQKITLKHGPIKKFDMDEGMTMVFRAQDPAMLTAIKAGDKVNFVPDRVNGQFTITKIEKAK